MQKKKKYSCNEDVTDNQPVNRKKEEKQRGNKSRNKKRKLNYLKLGFFENLVHWICQALYTELPNKRKYRWVRLYNKVAKGIFSGKKPEFCRERFHTSLFFFACIL